MKKITAFILCILCFSQVEMHNDSTQSLDESCKNEVLSIIFCGDVMGHQPQIDAAYNKDKDCYDYSLCFKYVKNYIEDADIAIANLEVTLAGSPYTGYPQFSSPDALLDALQHSGFDVILTANNHVADKGKKGLERSIRQIDKRKLLRAGSYINHQERDSIYPLIIEKKGYKIALLNATYGTNGMPVYAPNHVNMIDTIQIRKDICKAKESSADFIVMCIHWGEEYQLKANSSQRKIAQFLADEGVRLIIGSHPHVVQNMEVLYGKDSIAVPVYYSLGNFISNQRKEHSNGGVIVKTEIHIASNTITKSSFLPVYVHKGYLKDKYQFHLIPSPDYIKNPSCFSLSAKDSTVLNFFDKATRKRLEYSKNKYNQLLEN